MRANSGTFFARVYGLVAVIPPGKVMTYGQIAMHLGGVCSAKIVGYAMSCAPAALGLPCHRVVNKAGEMARGGIFGGEDRQRALLASEGVAFLPDGRIDMAASLFRTEQPPPAPHGRPPARTAKPVAFARRKG